MSTKNESWKTFKKAKEDALGSLNASERAKMTKLAMKACLGPAGIEFHNDENKYAHEFEFVRCKEITEEQKTAKYEEWTKRFKSGEFASNKKVAKKSTPKKRGETLDDLTLDEEELPEDITSTGTMPPPLETKEVPLETNEVPLETKKQEEWEALPVKERAKRTIAKQSKPKPKEKKDMDKPKSKKELLLEAINALEEEESAGITEEQVEKIAMRVVIKVLTDLNNEVSDNYGALLRHYIETHETIEECSKPQ